MPLPLLPSPAHGKGARRVRAAARLLAIGALAGLSACGWIGGWFGGDDAPHAAPPATGNGATETRRWEPAPMPAPGLPAR